MSRPFLKSISRLRCSGLQAPPFLRSLLRPSLTLLWDSLRWSAELGQRPQTTRSFSSRLPRPLAFGAPLPPSQEGTRVTPAMLRSGKVPPAGQSVLCIEKGSNTESHSKAHRGGDEEPTKVTRYSPYDPQALEVAVRDGRPVAVRLKKRSLKVSEVANTWRIDEEWWRKPISRLYFLLDLENGMRLTVFLDLEAGGLVPAELGVDHSHGLHRASRPFQFLPP